MGDELLAVAENLSVFQHQKPSVHLFLDHLVSVLANFFNVDLDIFELMVIWEAEILLNLVDKTIMSVLIFNLVVFYVFDHFYKEFYLLLRKIVRFGVFLSD